jgi:hypothetical protein
MSARGQDISKSLQPRAGYRPGDLEFRFRRPGYVLSIDVVKPGVSWWWITASIHVCKSEPSQLVFSHERFDNCSLNAACRVTTSYGATDCGACLNVGGASFALRPDEYAALREHLLPLGVPHEDGGLKVERETRPAPEAASDVRSAGAP